VGVEIQRAFEQVKEAMHAGIPFHAVVGFDGFVDRICRLVRTRHDRRNFTPFTTMSEFGEHILAVAGKSCDLEYVTEREKVGGNAPIMAHALSCLGVKTTLIGAVGYPELYPVFRDLHGQCRVISVSSPAFCFAHEFSDGKMMLADLQVLDELDWDTVKRRISLQELRDIFDASALVGFLNWSQLNQAESIWRGVLREVFPALRESGKRYLFVDLADLSKKLPEDLQTSFSLLEEFSGKYDVYLGLNRNETERVYSFLFGEKPRENELETAACRIFSSMGIEGLVVHLVDESFLVSSGGVLWERGERIHRPALLTGGGDNFNAGFCLGLLMGASKRECLLYGMFVAGFYVREGKSPSLEELAGECERILSNGEKRRQK